MRVTQHEMESNKQIKFVGVRIFHRAHCCILIRYNKNYKRRDKTELNIEHSTAEREHQMRIEYDSDEVDDLLKGEVAGEEQDPEDDPDVQDIRWFWSSMTDYSDGDK